jgi:hypothetical protein
MITVGIYDVSIGYNIKEHGNEHMTTLNPNAFNNDHNRSTLDTRAEDE